MKLKTPFYEIVLVLCVVCLLLLFLRALVYSSIVTSKRSVILKYNKICYDSTPPAAISYVFVVVFCPIFPC